MSALVMDVCGGVGGPAFLPAELHCWRGGGGVSSVSEALSAQMARVALSWPRSILSEARARGPPASRLKKRVVFADDKGLALVQIRLLRDPSCLDPLCALRNVKNALISPLPPSVAPPATPVGRPWRLDFTQPVIEYRQFCERASRNNVALESLTIAQQQQITGVIQVKNLSFEKQVFVRATCDRWRTHHDYSATYVTPPGGAAAPAALFDRFKFELPASELADKMEFCVAFHCSRGEFWDNNGGHNYSLSREPARKRPPPFRDAYLAEVDNWAYFSSWSQFDDATPFW